MNSLRSLGRAIEYEIERQIGAIEAGERIVQETRHWDEADGRTHSMRSKEGSYDYRYFPEPDLVPVAPTDEMRARVRASMPELPAARRARLVEEWGISDADARVLVATPGPRRLRRGRGRWRSMAARRRTSSTGATATCSGTSTRPGSRPRCSRSRPTGSPSSSAWSPPADLAQPGQGRARRVPRRAEAAEAGRRRARPRRR